MHNFNILYWTVFVLSKIQMITYTKRLYTDTISAHDACMSAFVRSFVFTKHFIMHSSKRCTDVKLLCFTSKHCYISGIQPQRCGWSMLTYTLADWILYRHINAALRKCIVNVQTTLKMKQQISSVLFYLKKKHTKEKQQQRKMLEDAVFSVSHSST